MNLTQEQRQAVDHPGNVLLKACPGSGKTKTIIARLVREIEHIRNTPFAVACITYTNAGVMEIDKRLALHLNQGDDRHYVVSTIHAFCLTQILRPFASRVPNFSGATRVLTPDKKEFREIADYAAEKVGHYELRYSDYEAFSGLNLDAEGRLIGAALENEFVAKAAHHFWE